jgi:peptide-methionine (S)-S-oxide reductase
MKTETAIFAAGCFWGVEATMMAQAGVLETEVGYMGGEALNPTYPMVCTGTSGHAEVVKVIFDPLTISYPELLRVFFACHDPTQLNRQGPDIGTQYRSALFCQTPEQVSAAHQAIKSYTPQFQKPIVTQVVESVDLFYKAEEYHQQYEHKKRCMYS